MRTYKYLVINNIHTHTIDIIIYSRTYKANFPDLQTLFTQRITSFCRMKENTQSTIQVPIQLNTSNILLMSEYGIKHLCGEWKFSIDHISAVGFFKQRPTTESAKAKERIH